MNLEGQRLMKKRFREFSNENIAGSIYIYIYENLERWKNIRSSVDNVLFLEILANV